MDTTFKKVSRSSSVIVPSLLFLARHLRFSNHPSLRFQSLYTFYIIAFYLQLSVIKAQILLFPTCLTEERQKRKKHTRILKDCAGLCGDGNNNARCVWCPSPEHFYQRPGTRFRAHTQETEPEARLWDEKQTLGFRKTADRSAFNNTENLEFPSSQGHLFKSFQQTC